MAGTVTETDLIKQEYSFIPGKSNSDHESNSEQSSTWDHGVYSIHFYDIFETLWAL